MLAQRARALGPISAIAVPAATAAKNAAPEFFSKRPTRQTGLMVAVVALNLVAATLWFFKGSAWSARIDGAAVARALARLEEVLTNEIVTELRSVPAAPAGVAA